MWLNWIGAVVCVSISCCARRWCRERGVRRARARALSRTQKMQALCTAPSLAHNTGIRCHLAWAIALLVLGSRGTRRAPTLCSPPRTSSSSWVLLLKAAIAGLRQRGCRAADPGEPIYSLKIRLVIHLQGVTPPKPQVFHEEPRQVQGAGCVCCVPEGPLDAQSISNDRLFALNLKYPES